MIPAACNIRGIRVFRCMSCCVMVASCIRWLWGIQTAPGQFVVTDKAEGSAVACGQGFQKRLMIALTAGNDMQRCRPGPSVLTLCNDRFDAGMIEVPVSQQIDDPTCPARGIATVKGRLQRFGNPFPGRLRGRRRGQCRMVHEFRGVSLMVPDARGAVHRPGPCSPDRLS